MPKEYSIQHRDGLLPVSVVLDGGGLWSKDKIPRAVQGISGPLIPRLSVRVQVVDEIDEGCCQRASPVNIKQVCDVRLGPMESVDRAANETGKSY